MRVILSIYKLELDVLQNLHTFDSSYDLNFQLAILFDLEISLKEITVRVIYSIKLLFLNSMITKMTHLNESSWGLDNKLDKFKEISWIPSTVIRFNT